jgi:hypothetical protein
MQSDADLAITKCLTQPAYEFVVKTTNSVHLS